MHRRTFIKNSLAASAVVGGLGITDVFGNPQSSLASAPLTKKSLKWGMIKEDSMSIMDKFKMLKEVGFDGVEFDAPNDLNIKEILAARDKTGLEIPGVVNSAHWKQPLSDPDPKVREACSQSMIKALNDCKTLGGTTVLLVPGVVNAKVSYKDAYERSQAEIRKLIPVAEKTGIKIALENVWNNLLISPVEAARYIDEINHPLVGWYFDVGNILRYGWPEHWIEALGKRIMKVDIKEFSLKKMQDEGLWKGFGVELGEGDCNWSEINKALTKAGYSAGWGSAEVPGGNRERLAFLSQRMDKLYKA